MGARRRLLIVCLALGLLTAAPGVGAPVSSVPASSARASSAPASSAPAASAPAASAPAPAHGRFEPGLLPSGPARGPAQRVLVRFVAAVPDALEREAPGLDVTYTFGAVPAVAATATPAALRRLAARHDVAYVEADKAIEFDLDSATVASRARDVVGPAADPSTPPLLDGRGRPVDGRGVGIAIVDSGLDATHPDFASPGKVGGNWLVTPKGLVAAEYTAPMHGHGTHVAGIAAGPGTASPGGKYRGVAPGATLYAFSIFAGPVSLAATAFDWILVNGAKQSPPIRVVNNSWHCSPLSCRHAFNPNQLHMVLATKLASSGITVTWSAGNEGGDGAYAMTNPEAANPTPGIIGVANYDDEGTGQPGSREGCLRRSSSRGAAADPATWPDVSAPGTAVWSTWAAGPYLNGTQPTGRNPVSGANTYYRLGGTSMAAPHAAGIVALMLQANPALTPREVEYLLKDSATPLRCGVGYARADRAHPWTAANYAEGHGLVDAYEAVARAQAFTGMPEPRELEPLPDEFLVFRPGIRVNRTWWFEGDAGLSEQFPRTQRQRVQPMAPNTGLSFTSAPLATPVTAEAVKLDVYVGTTGEAVASFTAPRIHGKVERIAADGTATEVISEFVKLWQIQPAAPTQRDFAVILPTPVTFAAGERIRATVRVVSPPVYVDPAPVAFWALYWEAPAASRVSLGSVVPRPAPDTREGCEVRQDCADLDDEHPLESLTCGNVGFRLSWSGPGGSALVFSCNGQEFVCRVEGVPGDPPGRCERDVEAPQAVTSKGAYCTALMPDGATGGRGRCVGLRLIEDDD